MAESQTIVQESERIRAALPLGIVLWVLVFAALLCAIAGVILRARMSQFVLPPQAPAMSRPEPKAGVVRTDLLGGEGAGDRLRAKQRQELQQYRWVDRQRGIVSIPIDVAMDLELDHQAGQAKP